MFSRIIIFFLFLLILFKSTNGQSKSQQVIDIEKIFSLVERTDIKAGDTVFLNKIRDSIAKQKNVEQAEFASLFVFMQKQKLYRNDSIKMYFDRWAQVFANSKIPAVRSMFKFYYGRLIFDEKDYSTGIQLMLEAKSEFESVGYGKIPEVSIPFYVLSLYYYHFNNYRKSIEYADIAFKYRAAITTLGANNTIGLAYQKLGLYDSAVIKFKETMQQAKEENIPVWYSIAGGNLGRTYCLIKNYSLGIPLLYLDVQTGKKSEPLNSALSSLYIADA